MQTTRRRPWWRSRWWMPLLAILLGAVVFSAMAIGGNPEDGLLSFAVLAAVAAVFWFGGRSDTLRGLGGPGRDERWSMIDLRATAFAGGAAPPRAASARWPATGWRRWWPASW